MGRWDRPGGATVQGVRAFQSGGLRPRWLVRLQKGVTSSRGWVWNTSIERCKACGEWIRERGGESQRSETDQEKKEKGGKEKGPHTNEMEWGKREGRKGKEVEKRSVLFLKRLGSPLLSGWPDPFPCVVGWAVLARALVYAWSSILECGPEHRSRVELISDLLQLSLSVSLSLAGAALSVGLSVLGIRCHLIPSGSWRQPIMPVRSRLCVWQRPILSPGQRIPFRLHSPCEHSVPFPGSVPYLSIRRYDPCSPSPVSLSGLLRCSAFPCLRLARLGILWVSWSFPVRFALGWRIHFRQALGPATTLLPGTPPRRTLLGTSSA